MTTAIDRRTVDRDGFVVGCDRIGFGSRPSVGGLSSVVARGRDVGVIVALDGTDETGLLLHLVWLPGTRPSLNVSQRARQIVCRAYETGQVQAEIVPAEGLVALDAWLPDEAVTERDVCTYP